jgi:hypothetical protein
MTKNNNNISNNFKDTFYHGMETERERVAKQYEEEEIKKCGVKTYRKKRETAEWDMVTVIPVGEIEVPDELDSFVKAEILDGNNGYLTYSKWIQKCYVERMKQILNDPAEFGKVVLDQKKRDHCIQNADDLENC